MQSESALKQAVQEQLDLILKIEQERKILKKQNKMLKQQHQKLLVTFKKYASIQRKDCSINTELQQTHQQPIKLNFGVQVDMQPLQVNTSKLSSAHELLKQLNVSSQQLCSRCEQQLINTTANNSYSYQPPKITKVVGNSQQVSAEIVKLAKQIATLKRELKETDSRSKLKDKQLRDLKKCLEVKSQALQKSRKDFNQLSNIFNTDKYKSLRNLQTQNKDLKIRNKSLQQQSRIISQLKSTLNQLTVEYEQYRQDRQIRLSRLISELKQKDSKCEQLSRQLQKSYSLL